MKMKVCMDPAQCKKTFSFESQQNLYLNVLIYSVIWSYNPKCESETWQGYC